MRSHRDIAAEAADWLARLDASAGSGAERAEFDRWIAADPAHEAAYLRLQAVWGRLDRLASLRHVANGGVEADLLAPLEEQPSPDREPVRKSARAPVLALAASAVIAAFGIAGYWLTHGGDSYTTNIGERRVVRLEDNSNISLNTQSALTVEYRKSVRRIEMRAGEAHFKVEKDPSRPFVVAVQGLEVRAVGTAFVVRIKDESVEIAVTEGVVAVKPEEATESAEMAVAARQVAMYAGGRGILREAEQPDLERKLAWESGMIAFDGEPLSEAVEEFNRYNTHKIVLADPRIAALRVGGYFRSDDLPGFVRALSSSFDLEAKQGGERVTYLSKAPAK